MSSVGASSKKRGTAYAAARAAKQRRQKVIVAILGVVLIAVLAYEVPNLLKAFKGSSTPAAPPVAAAPTAAVPKSKENQLKALRRASPSDPFAQAVGANTDPTTRNVGAPPGSIDPFAPEAQSGASQSSAPPPVTTGPLPQTIVIGTPGGKRKPQHGWIVILASIPTAEGRSSATGFAAKARSRGLSPVSVLNSSNRRPLRGGYWVVYTGPYATLSAVTSRAGGVQSNGYPTAYIRQLIVYR